MIEEISKCTVCNSVVYWINKHRRIFILDFSLYADVSTFGMNLACLTITIFSVILDSKLEKRPVTFGKAGTAATMLCVCHSPTDDLCFTGSDTGLVYVWQGTTLRRSVQAHKGPVCAMYSLSQFKQQVLYKALYR